MGRETREIPPGGSAVIACTFLEWHNGGNGRVSYILHFREMIAIYRGTTPASGGLRKLRRGDDGASGKGRSGETPVVPHMLGLVHSRGGGWA
jgi:hypothetical protein